MFAHAFGGSPEDYSETENFSTSNLKQQIFSFLWILFVSIKQDFLPCGTTAITTPDIHTFAKSLSVLVCTIALFSGHPTISSTHDHQTVESLCQFASADPADVSLVQKTFLSVVDASMPAEVSPLILKNEDGSIDTKSVSQKIIDHLGRIFQHLVKTYQANVFAKGDLDETFHINTGTAAVPLGTLSLLSTPARNSIAQETTMTVQSTPLHSRLQHQQQSIHQTPQRQHHHEHEHEHGLRHHDELVGFSPVQAKPHGIGATYNNSLQTPKRTPYTRLMGDPLVSSSPMVTNLSMRPDWISAQQRSRQDVFMTPVKRETFQECVSPSPKNYFRAGIDAFASAKWISERLSKHSVTEETLARFFKPVASVEAEKTLKTRASEWQKHLTPFITQRRRNTSTETTTTTFSGGESQKPEKDEFETIPEMISNFYFMILEESLSAEEIRLKNVFI